MNVMTAEKRAATVAAADSVGERTGDCPCDPPPPLRLPAELTTFPWDLAKAKLGFVDVDLLAILALLMVCVWSTSLKTRKGLSRQVYAPTGIDR